MLSIIIPTCDRNHELAKCLEPLSPSIQTLAFDEYEVIITDDGLNDTAEQMIAQRYEWAKWVMGPRRGPAANRNNGAHYAQGEWLVFLDDDCVPDPQWLESYSFAIVTNLSQLVFEGRTYADRSRQSLAETAPINETGGYLWSCNFMIQRKLFESLSGFDERFLYAAMEDVELRLRLFNSGHSATFVDAASVCHPWRPTGGREKIKQHQKATLLYLSIHPEERSRINSSYYLRTSLYELIQVTLPSIIRFKGKGLIEALWGHFLSFQMAARLTMLARAKKNQFR